MSRTGFLAYKLDARYGNVKRARGPFLYTEKGVRLTDLYAEGGRAILGWGGSPAVTALKDVLSRGITGSYKTDWDYRMDKALSDLLGFKAVCYAFGSYTAASEFLDERPDVWKPWSGRSYAESRAVIVAPPFPMADGITLMAVRKELDFSCPPSSSIRIPAPLQAAFSRSIYDVIKAEKERQEKDFFIYDSVLTRYWTRKGPWLTPKVPEASYEAFVLHCLDCELVISPFYDTDSIVPYGVDKGVFRKLERKPFSF
ncbi:MAG: hypothetical protein II837_10045 [Treponema sp.]|nr:hypothetical protein [Treponema sp.]